MKIQKYLTDFKTKGENVKSINSNALIVLEKNSYPYVCNRVYSSPALGKKTSFVKRPRLELVYRLT